MEENRKYQKARLRTFRWLLVISSVALVTLFITIGITLNRKIRISNSDILAKESITQFTKPVDQLCLALAAWKIHPSENVKEALLKAFNNSIRQPGVDSNFVDLRRKYLKGFRPLSTPIEFAGCSADNRFVYGYSADSIFLWNIDGTIFSGFSQGPSHIISLLMSSDGEYIGAVTVDSTLMIRDNKGNLKFASKTAYNNINKSQIFRFLADNMVIAISDTVDAILLDINGNTVHTFKLHKGSVNAVDFSEDGRFIATASSDSKINIWYLNSDTKSFELYNIITTHTDTVWSVDFANNNKYVVSTSADGRVLVNNVNGDLTSEFSNNVSDVENFYVSDPFFAEFDESGTGIKIKSSESGHNIGTCYMSAIYVNVEYYTARADETEKFDYIEFSPRKKYLVYCSGDNISLLSRIQFKPVAKGLINNYRLLHIEGNKPFFSPDGKYIYSISCNRLENWFIDIETICRIADDFYNKWINYQY
jgi:WD40 repeat protein